MAVHPDLYHVDLCAGSGMLGLAAKLALGDGYAPWLTSNGKPTQRPLSWRGWRTRPWIALLSGTTSSPFANRSSLATFADSLRSSSQRDTHASPSPSRASDWVSTMTAIYGRGLMCSLARRNPSACSWKTSQATFAWDSQASGEICSAEATALRRDYSARKKWARAIAASGCSSLRWNTPSANQAPNTNCNQKDKPGSLLRQAQSWPTPRTEDAERCGNHPNAVDSLTGAIALWPTPKTPTGGRETKTSKEARGAGGTDLQTTAQLWATPRAGKVTAEGPDHWNRRQAAGGVSTPPLAMQAALWPTPRSAEAEHAGRTAHEKGQHQKELCITANTWPTPMAGTETRSAQGGIQLTQTVLAFSRPAPETSTLGETSSRATRRLNPRFVEWLMGWPLGWSETACVLPATEWSRWQQAMHSSLWRLLCSMCDNGSAMQLAMEGISE